MNKRSTVRLFRQSTYLFIILCSPFLLADSTPTRSTDTATEPDMGSGGLLVRSYDGHNNNVENSAWGQAGQPLFRLFEHAYSEDGGATLVGSERPNPRDISNSVFKQEENEESLNIPNELGVSDFFWQWGQFLDHDLDLTPVAKPRDPADILATDTTFDPEQTGQFKLRFSRSRFIGGTSSAHPRQQVNIVSSWIDESNVYGSDSHRANALRMKDGTGRLKFSTGNLLPKNSNCSKSVGEIALFQIALLEFTGL